mmetsp:Transcript_4816/g.13927  ORF Transcript_4816/g.13927 Transcript_4816/m.13927 type:complete len:259 (+) Transcript_4816:1771-2547(+)
MIGIAIVLAIVRTTVGDEPLDGPGPLVPHALAEQCRLLHHAPARVLCQEARWGFLHHLLVPALDRALALDKNRHVDCLVAIAIAIVLVLALLAADDLKLNVVGILQVLFQEQPVVGKKLETLALGERVSLCQFSIVVADAHALATTPGGRLEQHRIPQSVSTSTSTSTRWLALLLLQQLQGLFERVQILVPTTTTGNDRHGGIPGNLLAAELAAHVDNRPRRRSQPGHARVLHHGPGKVRILAQKAIAGVEGVRLGGF